MAISSQELDTRRLALCVGSSTRPACDASVNQFYNRLTQDLPEALGDQVVVKVDPLLGEVQRFCFHVGNEYTKTGSFDSRSCITGILDNPASVKAGETRMAIFASRPRATQRETRTLFGAGSRITNVYEGMTITPNATTFAELLQHGKNIIVPPAPVPVPVPVPAPQITGSQVVIAAGGEREKKPFVTKAEAPQPMPVEGATVSVEVIPVSEGLRGSLSFKGGKTIYKSARTEIKVKASLSHSESPAIPSDPRFIHSPEPSPSAPRSNGSLSMNGTIPLDGALDISYPTADFIEDNYSARKLEAMCLAKWGEKAGGIYLDSVLRKRMATTLAANLETAWTDVVTNGATKYQEFLGGATLPNPPEVQVFADLFKDDPAGFVEMIALWFGKSYKEMKDGLTAQATALEGSNDSNRVANFEAFINAVRGLNLTKKFQLPQVPPGSAPLPSPHEEGFPSMMALEVDAEKLGKKETELADALNEKPAGLKTFATTANIPYPFEIANASNPWMAQANYNRLIAQLKWGLTKRATVYIETDIGIIPYGGGAGTGTGLGLEIKKVFRNEDGSDTFILGLQGYVGYPVAEISNGGIELKGGNFGAWAIGPKAEYHAGKHGVVQDVEVKFGLHRTGGTAPQHLTVWDPSVAVPVALTKDAEGNPVWTIKPYVSAPGSTGSGQLNHSVNLGVEVSKQLSKTTRVFVDLNHARVNKHTDISANDAPAADGSSPGLNDSATGTDPSAYTGTDQTQGIDPIVTRLTLALERGNFTGAFFLQQNRNLIFLDTGEGSGREESGKRLIAGAWVLIRLP